MAAKGHSVEVLATDSGWPSLPHVSTHQPYSMGGANLRYRPVDWWVRSFRNRLVRTFAFSSSLAADVRERVRAFDLIHIHMLYTYPTWVTARIAMQSDIPYVISPYGALDPYTHQRKGRLRKEAFLALFRKALDGAAALHYMSEHESTLAKDFALKAPVAVAPLGLSVDKYAALPQKGAFRRRRPELTGRTLIMYLGRISYTKGLDLLIDAFVRLAASRSDIHLLLVGPDYEGYGTELRRKLANHQLLDRATFTGVVAEPEKLEALGDADIFVMPSHTEAFGFAMLEAMACAAPVVTTDRAALASEFLLADAALVTAGNPQALAEGVERLLDDAPLRRRLADKGYGLVRGRFSWDTAADGFLELYASLLDRRYTASA